jgi:hypothetical protein
MSKETKQDMTDEPGPDDIDIGYVLAPLSREQVELIVVRLLEKHPESLPIVLAEAAKPIDLESLQQSIAAHADEEGNLDLDFLHGLLERAADFAKSEAGSANALNVLRLVAETVTAKFAEASAESDEFSEMQELLSQLVSFATPLCFRSPSNLAT